MSWKKMSRRGLKTRRRRREEEEEEEEKVRLKMTNPD